MAQDPVQQNEIDEAVGVFGDARAVERAVEDILTCGFDRADISLLATERTVRDKLGAYYQDTHAAEDDPRAPRRGWVGRVSRREGQSAFAGVLGYLGATATAGVVFATGGAALAAVAAAVVGGGATAAVGAALGRLIDRRVGETMRTQLEHGGVVLWVRLSRDGHADCALEVLRRHGAEDVHLHHLRLVA